MKRTKMIAFALIIAIALMGAGYAYWSDTLTIGNTVATGDLNVVFEESFNLNREFEDYDNTPKPGKPFKTGDPDYVNIGLEGNWPQVTLSEDEHTITFYNENFYPGAGAWLRFKVLNKGTIPAKVKEITHVFGPDDDGIKDLFTYTVDKVTLYKKDGGKQVIYNTTKTCDTFEEFIATLNQRLSKDQNQETIILEPGDWLEVGNEEVVGEGIGYDIFMKTSVSGNDGEKETLQFNLNLVYTQHNAQ